MTLTLNTTLQAIGLASRWFIATPIGSTTLLLCWGMGLLAAAYWLRLDAPIWGGLF